MQVSFLHSDSLNSLVLQLYMHVIVNLLNCNKHTNCYMYMKLMT